MAIRSDFEGLRDSIVHHSPLMSVDSIVSVLFVQETCLKSRHENGILSTLNPSMLAVPSKPSSNNQNRTFISPSMSAVL